MSSVHQKYIHKINFLFIHTSIHTFSCFSWGSPLIKKSNNENQRLVSRPPIRRALIRGPSLGHWASSDPKTCRECSTIKALLTYKNIIVRKIIAFTLSIVFWSQTSSLNFINCSRNKSCDFSLSPPSFAFYHKKEMATPISHTHYHTFLSFSFGIRTMPFFKSSSFSEVAVTFLRSTLTEINPVTPISSWLSWYSWIVSLTEVLRWNGFLNYIYNIYI